MNVAHLLSETGTVTARTSGTTRDDYGNLDTLTATRTVACWHEQVTRDENNPTATETWNLYLPPGDPITTRDRIDIGGVAFEVIGQPWQTFNPRTRENWQVEATLRRSEG